VPRNDKIRILNLIISQLPRVQTAIPSTLPAKTKIQTLPYTPNALGLPIVDLYLQPVILLRNIARKRGLYNGTCATIMHMSNHHPQILPMCGDLVGDGTPSTNHTLYSLISTLPLNRTGVSSTRFRHDHQQNTRSNCQPHLGRPSQTRLLTRASLHRVFACNLSTHQQCPSHA
jgi:hypothetical protein